MTMDIPRRVSADAKHPWFNDWWMRNGEVLIDGVASDRVVTLDVDEGWAEVLTDSFDDRLVVVRGKIELRAKSA